MNLSAGPISSVSFGIDGANQSLLFRGYTRDPAVGGSGGPVSAGDLLANAAYVTLVPIDNGGVATVEGQLPGGLQIGSVPDGLRVGEALYLGVYSAPEPSTLVMIAMGGAMALLVGRRRRQAA